MEELRSWTAESSEGNRRFHVPVTVRWRDLDAYGHVNNASLLTLLEEARIHAFWQPSAAEQAAGDAGETLAVDDGDRGARTHTLVASHVIEYRSPIQHGYNPLDVQLWVSDLGTASAEISYEVWNPVTARTRELHAAVRSTIVFIDVETQRPRRINDVERESWGPYLGAPVRLRSDAKTAKRYLDAEAAATADASSTQPAK